MHADPVAVVLDTVQQVVRELHPQDERAVTPTLDSTLERDLGLDSLGRAELLTRLERTCGVHLPEHLLATADTVRDLLRAVQGATAPASPLGLPEVRRTMPDVAAAPPQHAGTLVEVLEWHVHTHPQRLHITLSDTAEDITYAALYAGAQAVAAGLQARDLQPGHAVAIMLPTGRHFFEGFYGILLAGGIPVPLYPPLRPSQLADHLRRQAGILQNARAPLLITDPSVQPLARVLRSQVETLQSVVTVADLVTTHDTSTRPVVQPQNIALVQYTSGSTGTPKGVILTHTNLLANIRAMGQATRATSTDVFVSWLPLYHDMGLIGAWLGSLYYAQRLVLMSPLTFLARPARWLRAIHTHRGTISGAPNFAYELCLRKIDDRDLAGLDLSSWRLAFNGAEPVSPDTVTRFGARFAPYGFRPEAMTPVYGLAEAGLGLAFPPLGRSPVIDSIQRERFMRTGQAVPTTPDDPHALRFVACGQPLPGHQIRIVDAAGFEVKERQEGRVEFCGPSATSGYFHNPEETRRLFRGTWLDAGDLAYMVSGEVYVTGRTKDLIIRAGRNIYPQELEEAIGDIPRIRKGCVAVFGSLDPVARTERLVILAETYETDLQILEELRRHIDTVSTELLGAPPDEVVLAPPHTVPKTSSGKIRRSTSRELYEQGRLGRRQGAAWWQWRRLLLAGVLPQWRRTWRAALTLLYAAYAWAVFGVLAPLAWSALAVLPRYAWRQAVVRVLARLALRLAGIPLVVHGQEHLPQHGPYVLVVNHASYLDALVLLAVLPGRLRYVAKRELGERWLSRMPLQRLGVEFVERFAAPRGVEDTARVVQTVRQGWPVVFFPEGTFAREPGLRPFHMGAFVVAAQAGVPVVPLALRGTRALLRAEQWLPRRGVVRLTFGMPLMPQGTDWAAAVTLWDAARAEILRHCGEPDMTPTSAADLCT
jgi:1-acyl-sn-glycerol-3-phosphate acyltransferase